MEVNRRENDSLLPGTLQFAPDHKKKKYECSQETSEETGGLRVCGSLKAGGTVTGNYTVNDAILKTLHLFIYKSSRRSCANFIWWGPHMVKATSYD